MAEVNGEKRRAILKLGALAALLAGAAALAAFTPLGQVLSREGIGDAIGWLRSSTGAPVMYVAVYAGATALAIPGSILTLAGGAAFGLFCSSLFDNSATAITVAILAGLAALVVNLGLSPESQMLNFVTYVDRYIGIFESFSRGLSDYRFEFRLLRPGLVVPPVSALVFLLAARTIFARRDIHA